METDYSLQFRLIRQHEHETKKYLSVTISSTYGCALTLTSNEHKWRDEVTYYTGIKEVWTDMLERRKYEDFEDFRSRNYIYYKDNNKIRAFILKNNCDGRVIAQVISFSKISFFSGTSMTPQVRRPHTVRPIHGLKLSNSSAKIKIFEWNPMNPAMFAVPLAKTIYIVLFDLEKESSRILAKMEMKAPITAVSWNPDGTQLIVGDVEGRINQFNPQLKLLRTVNPPDLTPSVFPDKFACSGLCWVSKTERIVVFSDKESDKLHLTKLTVKPNKPPKWTVWDVLPAVEDKTCQKTFNFLPVFKWNTVLMSSKCLSEVYTFGIVNNIWQPLKLDERFTIKAPIEQILKPVEHKPRRFNRHRKQVEPTLESVLPTSANLHEFKKTFITSMAINYTSQQSAFVGQSQSISPQPVIYVTTSNGMLFIYQMVSLYSDRPSLFKSAEIVDKKQVINGPDREGYNLYNKSSTDSDASTSYSHSGSDWEREKANYTHRRHKKGTSTVNYKKDAEAQANFDDEGPAIMKLRKELIRLQEKDINAKKNLAKITYQKLIEAGKLSAYGVLEVYAAENENFNKIHDIKDRWSAMYHEDAKLIAEMKRLHCKLSADEFVAAVLSILSKPVARIMNLDADGLTVKGSDFFRVENTVLEVVCGVKLVKFTIV